MNLPTAVRFLPNGDMLILELGGKIWLVPAGTTQVRPTPFLSLTNIGEGYQGLMDMTLDPEFENNRYYYVYYTLGSPNRNRVARFRVRGANWGPVPGTDIVAYQNPQDARPGHPGAALTCGGAGKR
jgi:glucose/arabinose dehydrogenase